MVGGDDNDAIESGSGGTVMFGGNGRDSMYGFTGVDVMTGGNGADTFAFDPLSFFTTEDEVTAGMNGDRIVDFEHGKDKIELSRTMADGTFIGNAAFSPVMGESEVRYVKATGTLQGDTNGDGIADWTLTLVNKATLTAGDFIF